MENPLKNIFKRKAQATSTIHEAQAIPAMHSKSFSELVGQPLDVVFDKAIKESGSKVANKQEFNWLMNRENWNSPGAQQFKDGRCYFFFLTRSLDIVEFVSWYGSEFAQVGHFLPSRWHSSYSVVFRD